MILLSFPFSFEFSSAFSSSSDMYPSSMNPAFIHHRRHLTALTTPGSKRLRRSVIVNPHLPLILRLRMTRYLLNTLSGSVDEQGIANKSYAIRASVGYSFLCSFHHLIGSNASFSSHELSCNIRAVKYRFNSLLFNSLFFFIFMSP